MVRAKGGSLRFWGPGLLSTSPAFSMSSASHSAGSSGWLAQKTGAGPTFQWAGKVDAICRSRSNRAKRPHAGCILRSHISLYYYIISYYIILYHYYMLLLLLSTPLHQRAASRVQHPKSCGSQQSLPPGGKERLHFVGIRPEVQARKGGW